MDDGARCGGGVNQNKQRRDIIDADGDDGSFAVAPSPSDAAASTAADGRRRRHRETADAVSKLADEVRALRAELESIAETRRHQRDRRRRDRHRRDDDGSDDGEGDGASRGARDASAAVRLLAMPAEGAIPFEPVTRRFVEGVVARPSWMVS
jgi:hypothetical protein